MVTAKEVPPGGAGEIKATFKTKNANGKTKKTVTVQTNDPKNQRVVLTIQGKVISDVSVEPRYINFGTVSRDAPPVRHELNIRLREGKGIKLGEVRSDTEHVILEKVRQDATGATYNVALSADPPLGRISGNIVVQTKGSKSSREKVRLYAYVQGAVQVTPPMLSFGMIQPGEPVTKHVALRKNGEGTFAVLRVKTTSKSISTEIVPEQEGKRARINVTYNPEDRTQGRVSERLTIVVDGGDGKEEILEVPVYGNLYQKKAAPGEKPDSQGEKGPRK